MRSGVDVSLPDKELMMVSTPIIYGHILYNDPVLVANLVKNARSGREEAGETNTSNSPTSQFGRHYASDLRLITFFERL